MLNKKDFIISIIYLHKKIWGRVYLQKFIFLLNEEIFENKLFSFSYYKYGPFSEEINKNLLFLILKGFISEIEEVSNKTGRIRYVYQITEKGEKEATSLIKKISSAEKEEIQKYCDKFSSFTPTELLKYVYNKYPHSAENSIYHENANH